MAGPAVESRESGETQPPQSAPARLWAKVVKILKFVLAQWLVIGFALSCVFAYFFPSESGPFSF